MELALGHPTSATTSGATRSGVAGDFVTAPEISQMFGEIVGLWLAQAWSDLRPAGAGPPGRARPRPRHADGRPAARDRRRRRAFARRSRSIWSRRSPRLRALQAERLAGVEATWHERFEEVPPGPLLLVANEFLDALPVHQLVRTDGGWRRTAWSGSAADGALVFVQDDRPSPLAAQIPAAERPPGTVAEVSPARARARAGRSARGSRPRAASRC